jgi:hypothetical protein
MYLNYRRWNMKYAIIHINDLDNVDFTQIGETSAETIRKSLDDTMFVFKWETMPTFIRDGTIVPLQVLSSSRNV